MQNKDWSYLLGQKIGLLTVLEIYPPGVISIRPKKKASVARCVCECDHCDNLCDERERQYCCELCRYYGGGYEDDCAECDPTNI